MTPWWIVWDEVWPAGSVQLNRHCLHYRTLLHFLDYTLAHILFCLLRYCAIPLIYIEVVKAVCYNTISWNYYPHHLKQANTFRSCSVTIMQSAFCEAKVRFLRCNGDCAPSHTVLLHNSRAIKHLSPLPTLQAKTQ